MKKNTLILLAIIIILVILAVIKSRQTLQSDGYPYIEPLLLLIGFSFKT